MNFSKIKSPATVTEAIYGVARDFLHEEAALLDARRYSEWFATLASDLVYQLSCHELRDNRSDPREVLLYQESLADVDLRVKQISTPTLTYAGNPSPLLRRFVSNIRVKPSASDNEVAVSSNLLLWRSGGTRVEVLMYSIARKDILRNVDGEIKLASRVAHLDQTVVTTPNLPTLI